MKFYIDESGSFNVHENAAERASVVVGVAVPAPMAAGLAEDFVALRRDASGGRAAQGEVKGKDWLPDARREFCRMLERHDGVIVRGVIIDLAQFRGGAVTPLREGFRRAIDPSLTERLPPRARRDLADLRVWFANLSDSLVAKLYGWANCLCHLHRDVAAIPALPEDLEGWRSFEIVIDGPPGSRGRRDGRFFALAAQYWLMQWSQTEPVTVIGADHPMIEHLGAQGGLDLTRAMERLRFADSKGEIGLQVADVAAAIVRRAAESQGADPEALATYGWLMKASVERPGVGIGLATPFAALAGTRSTGYDAMFREYDLAHVRRDIEPVGGMVMMGPHTGEFPAVWGPLG